MSSSTHRPASQTADSEARHDTTSGREAARGSGVDKPSSMSGYTHLKKDDNGPPEAAWYDFSREEGEAKKMEGEMKKEGKEMKAGMKEGEGLKKGVKGEGMKEGEGDVM